MRQYELACIFNTKSDASALKEKMKSFINEISGTVTSDDDWGVRTLAYPILKQNEGYYYFVKFSAEPSKLYELKKNLHLEESLLRYMILKDEHEHVFKKPSNTKQSPSDKVLEEVSEEQPEEEKVSESVTEKETTSDSESINTEENKQEE